MQQHQRVLFSNISHLQSQQISFFDGVLHSFCKKKWAFSSKQSIQIYCLHKNIEYILRFLSTALRFLFLLRGFRTNCINVCQLSKKPPFTIEVCGKMSNRFEGNVRATFLLYSGSTTIFYKNHRKCKVFKIKVYVSFRFLRSRKEPECTRILAKWTNSLNREEV